MIYDCYSISINILHEEKRLTKNMMSHPAHAKLRKERNRVHIAQRATGLAVQLIGLLLCVWGLALTPDLLEGFQHWLGGKETGQALYVKWLKAIVLFSVGIVTFVGMFLRLREFRAFQKSISQYEDTPWKAVRGWHSDTIEPINSGRRKLIASMIVFWALVAPAIYLMQLIPVPLFIAGSAYVTFAIAWRFYRMRSWWKSRLRLDPMPARIGESLRGTFYVCRLRTLDTFRVTLECSRAKFNRFDFDSVSRFEVLWTHSIEIPSEATEERYLQVPIQISIPAGLPSSPLPLDTISSDGDVRWLLKVHAKSQPDKTVTFEVPVFKAEGGMQTGFTRMAATTLALPTPDEIQSLIGSRGFQVTQDTLGYKIVEIGRKRSELHQAAFLLIGTMICALIAIILWVPFVMFKIFLAFVPLTLSIGLGYALAESYWWKVVVKRREADLLIHHGLGVLSKSISLATNGTTSICSELMIRSDVTTYWNVEVYSGFDKKLTLWSSLSEDDADKLGHWIASELDIPFQKMATLR